MTRFETKGVELQQESVSRIQAKNRFEYSCSLCCSQGLRIECDRCAIQVAHEVSMKALSDEGIITKLRNISINQPRRVLLGI